MRPLPVPPAALRDDDAVQMIGAWIAERGLHCALNIGMWEAQGRNEPAAWGILLADAIRHIANAIEEEKGSETIDTINKIVETLLAELEDPTAPAKGEFVLGPN